MILEGAKMRYRYICFSVQFSSPLCKYLVLK